MAKNKEIKRRKGSLKIEVIINYKIKSDGSKTIDYLLYEMKKNINRSLPEGIFACGASEGWQFRVDWKSMTVKEKRILKHKR